MSAPAKSAKLSPEVRPTAALQMYLETLAYKTRERLELINITRDLNELIRKRGMKAGFVIVQSLHTTTAVFINEFQQALVDDMKSALEKIVKAQVKGGVDGIVPVGTTGESPTLDYEEHIAVIKRSVEFAAGKVKVLAGTGGNSTSEAIYLTKMAKKAGADGSLQVAPYYNKPTPEGLLQHFKAIAAATDLPLVLYSIPGRCGIEIAIDTVKRLAGACPTIIGIKEAGGNADRVSQLRAALGDKRQCRLVLGVSLHEPR